MENKNFYYICNSVHQCNREKLKVNKNGSRCMINRRKKKKTHLTDKLFVKLLFEGKNLFGWNTTRYNNISNNTCIWIIQRIRYVLQHYERRWTQWRVNTLKRIRYFCRMLCTLYVAVHYMCRRMKPVLFTASYTSRRSRSLKNFIFVGTILNEDLNYQAVQK